MLFKIIEIEHKSGVKRLNTIEAVSPLSFIFEKFQSPRQEKKKSSIEFIDRIDSLTNLVDSLDELPKDPPSLYVDLEGVNLSRTGSISMDETFLIDIHSLQEKAFSRRSSKARTLQNVLEDQSISKVFFDVRNDSDELFSHYGVRLAGVHDLQLMEMARRMGDRTSLLGLARCIQLHAGLTSSEFLEWNDVKKSGKKLFTPELGGPYEIFNGRPLSDEIRKYCVQDVRFLPKLWVFYNHRLNDTWERKVRAEVEHRIRKSQSPGYVPHGEHMARGPSRLQAGDGRYS